MHLERDLSIVMQSVSDKVPYVERLCSAGFLSQWLTTHMGQGGRDPRRTTRDDLIADDVPVVCNRRRTRKGGVLRPQMRYANKIYSQEKVERERTGLPRRTMAEKNTRLGALCIEYDSISPDEQAEFLANPPMETSSSDPDTPERYSNEKLWGLSSASDPIVPGLVEQHFMTRARSEQDMGGISYPAQVAREELATRIVVADENAIPKKLKVKYNAGCHVLHYGLCRVQDAAQFKEAKDAASILDHHLRRTGDVPEGSWLQLKVALIGSERITRHYFV